MNKHFVYIEDDGIVTFETAEKAMGYLKQFIENADSDFLPTAFAGEITHTLKLVIEEV